MYLEINYDVDTPIYLQIRNEIIKAIAKGKLKNGDSLPSVRQMSAMLEINLHTINKAYNFLKSEGYVNVDRRSGVTVNVKVEDSFKDSLGEELELILAKFKAKGLNYDEFLDLSELVYKNLK